MSHPPISAFSGWIPRELSLKIKRNLFLHLPDAVEVVLRQKIELWYSHHFLLMNAHPPGFSLSDMCSIPAIIKGLLLNNSNDNCFSGLWRWMSFSAVQRCSYLSDCLVRDDGLLLITVTTVRTAFKLYDKNAGSSIKRKRERDGISNDTKQYLAFMKRERNEYKKRYQQTHRNAITMASKWLVHAWQRYSKF